MPYSEDWFVEWFDSKYYHVLYQHRDKEEAELFIRNLANYLGTVKDKKALDLACGNGRHALYLHDVGFDVLGVDLSETNIISAKNYESEGLTFAQGDMRELSHRNEFDVVFNLFTSFGYFEDNNEDERTLSSIGNALKENGMLVIDYLNVAKVEAHLPDSEVLIRDEIQFNISKRIQGGFIEKSINFTVDFKEYNYYEYVKRIDLNQFQYLIQNTGFEVVDIFGDYGLNSFDLNDSDRLIVIAKKIA